MTTDNFRIEVGRRYRNGRGEIVGPIVLQEHFLRKRYKYFDGSFYYREDGIWLFSDLPTVYDLVEEVLDDPEAGERPVGGDDEPPTSLGDPIV